MKFLSMSLVREKELNTAQTDFTFEIFLMTLLKSKNHSLENNKIKAAVCYKCFHTARPTMMN